VRSFVLSFVVAALVVVGVFLSWGAGIAPASTPAGATYAATG
jgi:hypothetical protein